MNPRLRHPDLQLGPQGGVCNGKQTKQLVVMLELTNMLQNEDGEWHNFVPEGGSGLKAGPDTRISLIGLPRLPVGQAALEADSGSTNLEWSHLIDGRPIMCSCI